MVPKLKLSLLTLTWYELSRVLSITLKLEKSMRREKIPLQPDPALERQKKEPRKNGLINEDNNNINQQWKLRGQPPEDGLADDDHDDCVEVEEDLQEDSKDDYRVWCSPSSAQEEEDASLSETTVDNTCE